MILQRQVQRIDATELPRKCLGRFDGWEMIQISSHSDRERDQRRRWCSESCRTSGYSGIVLPFPIIWLTSWLFSLQKYSMISVFTIKGECSYRVNGRV